MGYAMTFQMYAILTMIKRHWYSTEHRIEVMVRSVWSTEKCFIPLMYEYKVINRQQKEVLQEWIQFLEQIFDFEIDAIIYIRTDLEVN